MLLCKSVPLQFRRKYCTFYSYDKRTKYNTLNKKNRLWLGTIATLQIIYMYELLAIPPKKPFHSLFPLLRLFHFNNCLMHKEIKHILLHKTILLLD